MPPEVARTRNIPNVWTLNLTNGQLQQLTDTLQRQHVAGGAARRRGDCESRSSAYYKGEERIHTIGARSRARDRRVVGLRRAGPDRASSRREIGHTLVPENIHKKGKFENMMLAGRPPIGLGVTSSGNFYGNTKITFTDLIGDQQFSVLLPVGVAVPRASRSST